MPPKRAGPPRARQPMNPILKEFRKKARMLKHAEQKLHMLQERLSRMSVSESADDLFSKTWDKTWKDREKSLHKVVVLRPIVESLRRECASTCGFAMVT